MTLSISLKMKTNLTWDPFWSFSSAVHVFLGKPPISALPQRFSLFCPSSWLLDGHSLSTEWRTDLLSRVSAVLEMEMGAIQFLREIVLKPSWQSRGLVTCTGHRLCGSGLGSIRVALSTMWTAGFFLGREHSPCLQTMLWLSNIASNIQALLNWRLRENVSACSLT